MEWTGGAGNSAGKKRHRERTAGAQAGEGHQGQERGSDTETARGGRTTEEQKERGPTPRSPAANGNKQNLPGKDLSTIEVLCKIAPLFWKSANAQNLPPITNQLAVVVQKNRGR